jgi:hypothetical protein
MGFEKYRGGQTLLCRVVATEPGGYAVSILEDNLPGFVPTEATLEVGQEILAQFVCTHKKRAVLFVRTYGQYQGKAAAQFRRITDAIPLPTDDQAVRLVSADDQDLESLLRQLQKDRYTGCIRVSNGSVKSRAAALLYKGRVVGCVYANSKREALKSTEPSLRLMLKDLKKPGSHVMLYSLPEEMTICISALFLGYPVKRTDKLDAKQYLGYICDWLRKKGQTACLVLVTPSDEALLLGFVYRGNQFGAFDVQDQQRYKKIEVLQEMLEKEPGAQLTASILPPELTSSPAYGFTLSSAKQSSDQ